MIISQKISENFKISMLALIFVVLSPYNLIQPSLFDFNTCILIMDLIHCTQKFKCNYLYPPKSKCLYLYQCLTAYEDCNVKS